MNSLKEPKKVKSSEINEIKNIKYKTMTSSVTDTTNMGNLDLFLENEKFTNQSEPWSKLDKTSKYRKVVDFIERYAVDKSLTEDEKNELHLFLKDAIDKKKLQKVKDIIYDKTTNTIKDIPGLVFLKSETKNFTLKNMSTKVNTLKSAPKKKIT